MFSCESFGNFPENLFCTTPVNSCYYEINFLPGKENSLQKQDMRSKHCKGVSLYNKTRNSNSTV